MHTPVTRRHRTAAAFVRTAVLALLAAFAVAGLSAGPARAEGGAVAYAAAAPASYTAQAAAAQTAESAQADGGEVAWTVRTASNSYGADRSSFGYTLNPGGRAEDTMVVANRGKDPLKLAVYAADGFTTDAGRLDLLPRGKKSAGVGVWVRAGRGTVEIKPGQTADVPFTVAVPANATPGDYVGGLLTSLTQSDDAEGINVDRRLGIRITLRVSGALKPALAVEQLHVGYDGSANPFAKGDATVTYTIHNTGNAVLSAEQKVSLAGPFGWLRAGAGAVAAPPQLLPGERWKVTVPVHGVAPSVRLAATVTLTPRLTDASGSTTSLAQVHATAHAAAVPWTLALLVAVLLAAAAGTFLLARRGRARRKLGEEVRVRDAVAQALRDQGA